MSLIEDDEIRIDNLKPSTTYIFRIRAKNEVGTGRDFEISVSTAAIRKSDDHRPHRLIASETNNQLINLVIRQGFSDDHHVRQHLLVFIVVFNWWIPLS